MCARAPRLVAAAVERERVCDPRPSGLALLAAVVAGSWCGAALVFSRVQGRGKEGVDGGGESAFNGGWGVSFPLSFLGVRGGGVQSCARVKERGSGVLRGS